MSDFEDLCENVNKTRDQYGAEKNKSNHSDGLKEQFECGIAKNADWVKIIYMIYETIQDASPDKNIRIKIMSQKFDKNGNTIGE